jgi:hypothetical protein
MELTYLLSSAITLNELESRATAMLGYKSTLQQHTAQGAVPITAALSDAWPSADLRQALRCSRVEASDAEFVPLSFFACVVNCMDHLSLWLPASTLQVANYCDWARRFHVWLAHHDADCGLSALSSPPPTGTMW